MRHAYLVLSLCIIAFGLIHIAATPRYSPHLTGGAVWFASGGLAIILAGALNLLRRAYGEIASGLRLVCVIANVVMTTFSLLAGYATNGTIVQFAVVLGLWGGVTVFSLLPGAQSGSKRPPSSLSRNL